jgi:hypothetical protein
LPYERFAILLQCVGISPIAGSVGEVLHPHMKKREVRTAREKIYFQSSSYPKFSLSVAVMTLPLAKQSPISEDKLGRKRINHHLKCAGLHNPFVVPPDEREMPSIEDEFHLLFLAWLQ